MFEGQSRFQVLEVPWLSHFGCQSHPVPFHAQDHQVQQLMAVRQVLPPGEKEAAGCAVPMVQQPLCQAIMKDEFGHGVGPEKIDQ